MTCPPDHHSASHRATALQQHPLQSPALSCGSHASVRSPRPTTSAPLQQRYVRCRDQTVTPRRPPTTRMSTPRQGQVRSPRPRQGQARSPRPRQGQVRSYSGHAPAQRHVRRSTAAPTAAPATPPTTPPTLTSHMAMDHCSDASENAQCVPLKSRGADLSQSAPRL